VDTNIEKINRQLKKKPIASLTRKQKVAKLKNEFEIYTGAINQLKKQSKQLSVTVQQAQMGVNKIMQELYLYRDYFGLLRKRYKNLFTQEHSTKVANEGCQCPCHFLHISRPDGLNTPTRVTCMVGGTKEGDEMIMKVEEMLKRERIKSEVALPKFNKAK